jgi:hypothetical protein
LHENNKNSDPLIEDRYFLVNWSDRLWIWLLPAVAVLEAKANGNTSSAAGDSAAIHPA